MFNLKFIQRLIVNRTYLRYFRYIVRYRNICCFFIFCDTFSRYQDSKIPRSQDSKVPSVVTMQELLNLLNSHGSGSGSIKELGGAVFLILIVFVILSLSCVSGGLRAGIISPNQYSSLKFACFSPQSGGDNPRGQGVVASLRSPFPLRFSPCFTQ